MIRHFSADLLCRVLGARLQVTALGQELVDVRCAQGGQLQVPEGGSQMLANDGGVVAGSLLVRRAIRQPVIEGIAKSALRRRHAAKPAPHLFLFDLDASRLEIGVLLSRERFAASLPGRIDLSNTVALIVLADGCHASAPYVRQAGETSYGFPRVLWWGAARLKNDRGPRMDRSPPGKSQNGCSVGKNGAPGTIRTCDPRIRSPILYPAELRARRSGE